MNSLRKLTIRIRNAGPLRGPALLEYKPYPYPLGHLDPPSLPPPPLEKRKEVMNIF